MKGEQVSAIERNRMKRALADIFLMFPFSIFVIIPGAELLIPVTRLLSAVIHTFLGLFEDFSFSNAEFLRNSFAKRTTDD